MVSLSLWLCGGTPELIRTEFSHPLLSERRVALRAKNERLSGARHCFQWTPAVRALCVLLLRSKLVPTKDGPPFLIEGRQRSLAASLDYALSKQTGWLISIFGSDSKGLCIFRRNVIRKNSNRKRVGPVALGLTGELTAPDAIRIYHQNRLVTEREKIELLVRKIAGIDLAEVISSDAALPCAQGGVSLSRFCAVLREAYVREVQDQLSSSIIFSHERRLDRLRRLQKLSWVEKLSGGRPLTEDLDGSLSSSERLGVCHSAERSRELLTRRALSLAIPALCAPAMALFSYLTSTGKMNLKINYRFGYAIEIKRKIQSGNWEEPPDLCLLGLAPAAELLGSGSEYRPLMLFPAFSHRLVLPKGVAASDSDRGDYLLIQADPSTSRLFYEDLQARGSVKPCATAARHAEPDEMFTAMASGDKEIRGIGIFPHFTMNEVFNGATLLNPTESSLLNQESFLFAHERLWREPELLRCLDVAVRDAWLSLRSSAALTTAVVDKLLDDTALVELASRWAGVPVVR